MIPRYKVLQLSNEQIRNSLYLQVLAYQKSELINWPPEPWHPISGLDCILYNIRDYGRQF
jgi:hypothetical protein